ncbi:hypothetical protein RHSIM_Rhsim03G0223400 [Rhododendron simsii]|uniref:Uncharacterized protein n=1 Tax=Rhododendron simsii TaxID=118357 RepID=A0A834LVS3_RHOSS|nr:hypothetical protein RHSIM_Rhsim03G0223400 [Rhododendron simsii]
MEQQEATGATEKKEREKEFICKRCKQNYTTSSNNPTSCRFHPSFFVCRRHDDQKRVEEEENIVEKGRGFNVVLLFSVDITMHICAKPGGGRRAILNQQVAWYYELRPDDPPYAAKFYDCCGAEDPNASGCSTSFHVSYDEE